MNRLSLLVVLAPLAVVAACAPKPAPPPAPVMTGPEAVCAARGATTAGVDVSTVTVVPTASTKAGDTIYTVTANGIAYNCVVDPDGTTISTFSPQ